MASTTAALTSTSIRARFREERRQRYPIEWEEITVDLRALAEAGPAVRDYPATWQDTLFNFAIHLTFYADIYERSRDVDELSNVPGNRQYPAHRSRRVGAGENCRPGISRWRWGRPARCSPRLEFLSVGGPIRRLHGGCGGGHRRRWRCGSRSGLALATWTANHNWAGSVASNDGLGGFEPTQEILPLNQSPYCD